MFVHAQSFEDLTVDSAEQTEPETDSELGESGESAEEVQGLVGEEEAQEEEKQQEEARPESKTKEEDVSSEAWRSHRKHVFVLSEAGKPIYSRYGTEEALSSTIGVMMALVSFVEAEKNIIRSIQAGQDKVWGVALFSIIDRLTLWQHFFSTALFKKTKKNKIPDRYLQWEMCQANN